MYPRNYTVYLENQADLERLGHVLDDLGLDVDVTSGEVALGIDKENPLAYVSFQVRW